MVSGRTAQWPPYASLQRYCSEVALGKWKANGPHQPENHINTPNDKRNTIHTRLGSLEGTTIVAVFMSFKAREGAFKEEILQVRKLQTVFGTQVGLTGKPGALRRERGSITRSIITRSLSITPSGNQNSIFPPTRPIEFWITRKQATTIVV